MCNAQCQVGRIVIARHSTSGRLRLGEVQVAGDLRGTAHWSTPHVASDLARGKIASLAAILVRSTLPQQVLNSSLISISFSLHGIHAKPALPSI